MLPVLARSAATRVRHNMEIVALGLGDWIDRYELQAIASDSYRTNLIYIDDYRDLPNFVDQLKGMLCNGTVSLKACICLSSAHKPM